MSDLYTCDVYWLAVDQGNIRGNEQMLDKDF